MQRCLRDGTKRDCVNSKHDVDGADLAPNQTLTRPAELRLSPGQTYDVEVTAASGAALRLRHRMFGLPEQAAPTQYLRVETK